jgi:hypothetical protein
VRIGSLEPGQTERIADAHARACEGIGQAPRDSTNAKSSRGARRHSTRFVLCTETR